MVLKGFYEKKQQAVSVSEKKPIHSEQNIELFLSICTAALCFEKDWILIYCLYYLSNSLNWYYA